MLAGGTPVPELDETAAEGLFCVPGAYEMCLQTTAAWSAGPDYRWLLRAPRRWPKHCADTGQRVASLVGELRGGPVEAPRWLFGGASLPLPAAAPPWLQAGGVPSVEVWADDSVRPVFEVAQ